VTKIQIEAEEIGPRVALFALVLKGHSLSENKVISIKGKYVGLNSQHAGTRYKVIKFISL
jgi:hypothetical protein